MELGYALSSEEHSPEALVANARRCEEAGFTFALISDHCHPWVPRQGESAFVWTVLGALARETTGLRVGTGVTCPTVRMLVVCGPDPAPHGEAIRAFAESEYDRVYVHQIGPDQEGFFRFYGREVIPGLTRAASTGAAPLL